jgi:putative membrane protein
MMKWTELGFTNLWSPAVFFFIVLLGVAYALTIGKWRPFFLNSEPVNTGRQFSFYFGLFLYYIAYGSPMNYLGHHYMFSFHMMQQTLAYLIVPLLVWRGLPEWLIKPLLDSRLVKPVSRLVFNPVVSILTFNMIFSIYHIPLVFNYVYEIPWLHAVYHYVLLLSAFQMWFLVFCPVSEYDRLSSLQKMAFVFGMGVLITPACALIIFAGKLLYPHYAEVPSQLMMLPLLEDQQLGGVIMKIMQEIVYGTVIGFIFFRWFNTEKRKEKEEEEKEELERAAREEDTGSIPIIGNGRLNQA